MKKVFLSIFSLSLLCGGLTYAQNYVNENFNNVGGGALPANWSAPSYWKTGTPNATVPFAMSGLGVSLNSPAHMAVVGVDGVVAADSSILATPTFSLPGSATATKLVFDLSYFKTNLSKDPTKKETLTFIVSTNGGSTWTDVSELTAVSSATRWETRAITLGTYAGQNNMKVGFRYNNTGTRLVGAAFDNIRVYVQSANDIAIASASPSAGSPESYKEIAAQASISGTVFNYGSSPITAYTVYYKTGSSPSVSYNVTNVNIAPLTGGTFNHATPFTVPSAGEHPLNVWVVMAGDTYHGDDTAKAHVTGIGFMPVKKLVFEEPTGTWCVWCPRGSVKMEEFAEAYPGVAAQIAVHNNDPMAIANYDTEMRSYIKGYPSLVVDRTLVDDPGNVLPIYNTLKNKFGYATVTLGTVAVSGNAVTAPVTIKPAVSIKGAKLALVVTESNVTGTGAGWAQQNAYAGGASGKMGGYEKEPRAVEGVRYHFVARSITPSAGGAASGLPATMDGGSTYDVNLTATLNPSWNSENLQYIVLLIDADGKIMNSDFSPLPILKSGLPSAITNIEAGIEDAFIYPNPTKDVAYLSLNAKNSSLVSLKIMDALGRKVTSDISSQLKEGQNTISIPTAQLANGMYLIQMTTDHGNMMFKLQVVK